MSGQTTSLPISMPAEIVEAIATLRIALDHMQASIDTCRKAPQDIARVRASIAALSSYKPRVLTCTIYSEIERQIVERLVFSALDAGCAISINNGGDEDEVVQSRDLDAIGSNLGQADEDTITLYRDGAMLGFVHLVYGNGSDVISDNTPGNEMAAILSEAEGLAELFGCT